MSGVTCLMMIFRTSLFISECVSRVVHWYVLYCLTCDHCKTMLILCSSVSRSTFVNLSPLRGVMWPRVAFSLSCNIDWKWKLLLCRGLLLFLLPAAAAVLTGRLSYEQISLISLSLFLIHIKVNLFHLKVLARICPSPTISNATILYPTLSWRAAVPSTTLRSRHLLWLNVLHK